MTASVLLEGRKRVLAAAVSLSLIGFWLVVFATPAWADCVTDCTTVPGNSQPVYLARAPAIGKHIWNWRPVSAQAARREGVEYDIQQYCYWRAPPGCYGVGPDRCPYNLTLHAIYQRPLGSPAATEYTKPQMACILPAGPPPVTPADVRRVVRGHLGELRIAVRGDPFMMQPPHHEALAEKPVIFFLSRPPHVPPFTAIINGQQVRITPYPGSYVWHFEPEAAATTADIGHPYPDQDPQLAYQYGHLGTVRPYVTVNWKASFRVGNGPLRQAYPPGQSLPVDGQSQPLQLLNQHSVLVGPGG